MSLPESSPPSPSPRISPRMVLGAINQIARRGQWPLLQQLEREEPELAEQVLEGLSQVHEALLATGAPHRTIRRLQRQIQSIVLITVLCMRQSQSPEPSPDTDNSPAAADSALPSNPH